MDKDELREALFDVILICDSCIDLIDGDDAFMTQKVALGLSVADIKIMKVAKMLQRGLK